MFKYKETWNVHMLLLFVVLWLLLQDDIVVTKKKRGKGGVFTPSKVVKKNGFICYMLLTCECYIDVCSGLSERGAEGAAAMVGTGLPIYSVLKGCKIQQTIKSCFLEAGTMIIQ